MAFPDSFLDELRRRNDIQDVVSDYLPLKKSGSNLFGLCPFHTEKTPSFSVSPDKQIFHCFGCGAGGDVITFIRRIENLDYVEAVRFLAKRAGLEMPDTGYDSAAAAKRRERILAANREAARFYHATLMSDAGARALEYLLGRGISRRSIVRFGLGFAPDQWDGLLRYMRGLGYSPEELREAGLVHAGKSGGHYDVFRNRVMFPILDLRGSVVGFGGRVMDDSHPKYLNSSDTPVFKKNQNLFALRFAKNAPKTPEGKSRLILCEGYMDVISMHQAGFSAAVATLGTAITQEQARLMARYASEVIVAYDSDEAGRAAAQRAIDLLSAAGLEVRILDIPGCKDPDEFIRKYGAERFDLLLRGSGGHVDYRLAQLRSRHPVEIPEEKIRFLREAAEVLAALPSELEREVHIGRLAEETSVPPEAIRAEVAGILKKKSLSEGKKRLREQDRMIRGLRDPANPEKSERLKAARAEERLIALLYRNPDCLDSILSRITPDDFATSFNAKVFGAMVERLSQGLSVEPIHLSALFEPHQMARIASIFASSSICSGTEREVQECVEAILLEKRRIDPAKASQVSAGDISRYIKNELSRKKSRKTGDDT